MPVSLSNIKGELLGGLEEMMSSTYPSLKVGAHTHTFIGPSTSSASVATWGGTGGASLTGTTTVTIPAGTYFSPTYLSPMPMVWTTLDDPATAKPVSTFKQFLKSGDMIVCKNNHPICVVMEDFEYNNILNKEWVSKMSFWQQDKPDPKNEAGCDCHQCRASFMRAIVEDNGYVNFEFIIRPNTQEQAA